MDRGAARQPRPRLIGSALSLVALVLVLAAPGAAAGWGWCRSDPVVGIDGKLADIIVEAPVEAPLNVTGATEIVIRVPVGVRAKLILAGPGFGKGEKVRFDESRKLRKTQKGIEVKVEVYVPATDDAMPVRVRFAPHVVGILRPASAEGTANDWVVLTTHL